MRIMLDTNVFDRVIATEGLVDRLNQLAAVGRVALFTSPVQEAELARIPDPARRKAAQRVRRTVLPGNEAPTAGGLAPTAKHQLDAIVGATATGQVDVLVTEDLDFARRLRGQGGPVQVWTFAQLAAYAESL